MDREHEVIKRLVNLCIDYETELQIAHRVLAAIRLDNPSLPVLATLDFARAQPDSRNAAEAKFGRIRETIENRELAALLDGLPKPRYEN